MKKFLLSILCLIAVAMTGYAVEATVTFSDFALDNGTELTTLTSEDVTLTFSAGTNSSTTPKYYTTGTAARLYGGNTMTITLPTGFVINSVILNTGSNNKFHAETSVSAGTFAIDGTVGTISDVNAETVTLTQGGTSGHVRITDFTISYTLPVKDVADPTFSVEAGTYDTKQSVELAHENADAKIYYTLDGTTPDSTSTLYETAIELNTKTTVKAIAYVGEDASNVASATYDFKLEGTLEFVTAAIFASKVQAKIEWTADYASGVNYIVTTDGTVPTVDNKWNTGIATQRNIPMYTWKKDTAVVISVRAEQDGIYGDVFKKTFYIKYDASLTAYKAIGEMAAGNYVMGGENTVMLPITAQSETKQYNYGYTEDATIADGLVSAMSYFEFAFEATEGGYYIKDAKGQYLSNDGYKTFSVSTDIPAEGGVWSVELQDNGQAKILNTTSERWIQWDSTYKNWALNNSDQATFMPTLYSVYEPVVTMTPEANATVETLDKITFYCADGIEAGSKYNYCSVQGTSATVAVSSVNQVDSNTVEFILAEPVTNSGEYTFVLYKEVLTLAPNSLAKKYPSATEYITLTVNNPYQITLTPSNADYLPELKDFTFSCDKGIAINPDYAGEAPFVGYTDASGNSVQVPLAATATSETSITLSTAEAITQDGYATLVIGEGYFTIAGDKTSSAYNEQYMVITPISVVTSTPQADAKVESFVEMNVELNKEVMIYEYALSGATLVDAEGNATNLTCELVDSKEVSDDWGWEYYTVSNKLRFYLAEAVTTAGEYKVVIPGEYLREITNGTFMTATEIAFTIEVAQEEVKVEFLGVTPTEGTVTELNGIFIETNQNILFPASDFTLTDANGTEYSVEIMAADRNEDGVSNDIEVAMEAITAAGTYTLNIPAGSMLVLVEGQTEPVQASYEAATYTWTIEEAATPTITAEWSIEDGAVIESFESISLTLSGTIDGAEITAARPKSTYNCFYFYQKDADGNYNFVQASMGSDSHGYLDCSNSGTTSTFTPSVDVYGEYPYTVAGDYRIVIPAGDIFFNGDRSVVSTAEYVLNFTIVPGEGPVYVDAAYTLNPEEFTTLTELREFEVTFTGYESVEVAEFDYDNYTNVVDVSIEDELTGSYYPAGYMKFEAGSTANSIRVSVLSDIMGFEAYTQEGGYRIIIPKGIVTFSDGMNNAIELYYFVEAEEVQEGLYVTATDPAQNETYREVLNGILVTWNMDISTTGGSADVYMVDVEGTKVSEITKSWVDPETGATLAGNQIYFSLDTPLDKVQGEYTLVIEAGYMTDFMTESYENEEIRLVFDLDINSGIAGVKADATNGYVVYDLNGYRVMQTRNVADLQRLDNGIYIINGVKVLINK